MKIVKAETFRADGGWEPFSFLKLTTDEGLVGWSEFSEARGRRGLGPLVASLAEQVINLDPRDVARIGALLYGIGRQMAGGMMQHALGAVENACLDIKAKALGVPVYELFGGRIRDRLPIYWSHCGFFRCGHPELFEKVIGKKAVRTLADLQGVVAEAREAGFKALKTNLMVMDGGRLRPHGGGTGRGVGHPELNIDNFILSQIDNQLTAIREVAGPEMGVAMDFNFNYRPEGFRRIANLCEKFNMMWIETDSYEAEALALIRASTSTPIGSLEAVLGRRHLRPFLENRSVDVCIIDVQWNGMMEAFKMAAMADAYDVNVASHCSAGPLNIIKSAHFCAVLPNLRITEVSVDKVPWKDDLLTNPPVIENGHLLVPTGPGWGTEVNEAVVRAHPWTG